MLSFVPSDDNRKFTELYSVQRLKNSSVPKDVQVCVDDSKNVLNSKDEELDEILEEQPAELLPNQRTGPVAYTQRCLLNF